MSIMETDGIIGLDSWPDLQDIFSDVKFRSWAFRGQADAGWPLLSTLSRYLIRTSVLEEYWKQQESRILRIFQRKSHLFLPNPPPSDDSFEWLSIMQHHGAPTRLLDFTWSPYVAAFFALQNASEEAAIWAIFPPGVLGNKFKTIRADQLATPDDIGPWTIGNYERYFQVNENNIVVIGEPHRMNQRLIAQSGTFAMPGVLNTPIEQLVPPKYVKKIVIRKNARVAAMRELYQMNISEATLFPGLDGLARSLAFELESHWAFDPLTGEKYAGFYMD